MYIVIQKSKSLKIKKIKNYNKINITNIIRFENVSWISVM